MPATLSAIDDLAPVEPDCWGAAGDDGTRDDAGPLPLGGHRRELSDRPAGVPAYCRLARRLAAPDRRGDPVDLLGPCWALRQPQCPAYGTPVRLAPRVQAAVRCRAVHPLHRPLCRAGSPPQVWP